MAYKKEPNKRTVVRKRRKLKKKIYFVLFTVLFVILGIGGYGAYLYKEAESTLAESYVSDSRPEGKSERRTEEVNPQFDNVSILIMGIDASDKRGHDDDARTDALMLATLNKDEKSVKLLSIPRDSYVFIPEVGYETRINHAHAYGGENATIATIENLLDIPIDYWVKVNFNSFIDVVDALDGITVEVPYNFSEQDSNDKANAIHLQEGRQQLNGEEALALARTRKLDNDIERGKRQQDIIKAIIDRTVSLNSILKYDDIIRAVGENMTTNMLFNEIKSFIAYGTEGTNLDIETMTLEGTDYQPGGMYFWQLDEVALDDTKRVLQRHLDISNGSSYTESYKTKEALKERERPSY